MSDFTMRTILGKGFAQAQVHTVNSTSAEVPFAKGRMMHLQSIFHYGDFINAAIGE